MLTTLGDGFGMDTLTFVLFMVIVAIGGAGWVMHNREQKKRAEAERQLAGQFRVHQHGSAERDALMFEQHRRINDLGIAKLEAEVALLQSQVKTRMDDEDRLTAAREFHELSVEKTKLEIDSLRLHIAEQRKRIDDWGLGGHG
ncbi:MAG TPA: hypothetical protein VEB22_07195 [Phycisphaerales bacterium]|nr:hypothetical protein [Phycisphaerales bacterium]